MIRPAAVLLACAVAHAAEPAVDHAGLIRSLDDAALQRGAALYQNLCASCHGTPEKPGSLPASRAFWKEPFKNGGDPFGIYQTLSRGLGQMPAWPMLPPQAKYDLAHYIRESLVRPANPAAYVGVTREYLRLLPKAEGTFVETEEMREFRLGPKYLRMDFGPALMWTLEAEKDNIACKGIAVRLDKGDGGVSKGRTWMLYDHDTLRMAAAWSGDSFVDWSGIAFDGSHGTHTSIRGEVAFTLPDHPAWADPADNLFKDPRVRGLDGKPYGPLPRSHARLRGVYQNGGRTLLSYTVGGRGVLETPGCETSNGVLVFTRTFEVSPGPRPIRTRVSTSPVKTTVSTDQVGLATENGFHVLGIPASGETLIFTIRLETTSPAPAGFTSPGPPPAHPSDLTRGGPPRWPQTLVSENGRPLSGEGLGAEPIAFPDDATNPWGTQWRTSGLDFLPDGDQLALCTWMGDVWIVSGLRDPSRGYRWKRIASGLHQPLGLKIVDGVIHVCCRDQIVKLRDLNGDGETDYYECFNNDHQVTEHFHEFAMGLQTDEAGNFYYAKSARHALPPLVPQHGTLLRVSRDGLRTDIVANGFRAANGVCVNTDGSFHVTDQEGHWMPKNRINQVKPGRFYGNMWSYGAPQNTADSAMEEPLVWITNDMDRSPGEPVRVTPPSWGPLQGSLLDLSYGMGRMFLVMDDASGEAQSAVVALPLEDFPTGVMRGRFHPATGELFACGMAVWASNQTRDGGLYRIRRSGGPMHLPVSWRSSPGQLRLTFSDPLDPSASNDAASYQLKSWDLLRSAKYGSAHLNERQVRVTAAKTSTDGREVTLDVPGLAPSRGLELVVRLKGADGGSFERRIHATIHRIGGAP